jgi:DNA-binding response OmpR family regulator
MIEHESSLERPRGAAYATTWSEEDVTRPLILVVEDDPGVRAPLEKFLTLHGFDVISADTAEAAQRRLQESRITGAVVDLRLRQGSGREVVLSIPPPTPIVIFSAVPEESARLERIRSNTRLILKPFSLVMLVETLTRMIDAVERKDPGTKAAAPGR